MRSEKARTDLEPAEVDVGLTVKLQQKLKETQQTKDKLEKKVEELESNLLKHKTQQSNVADTLKVYSYGAKKTKHFVQSLLRKLISFNFL